MGQERLIGRRRFIQKFSRLLMAAPTVVQAALAKKSLSHHLQAFSEADDYSSPTRPQSTVRAENINVRHFGATGDGITNDTHAFQAAANEINRRGGGVLYIPEGSYIVGKQELAGTAGKGFSYLPAPIIEIKDCPRPVTVIGHKRTRLVAAPGLRLGSFDPVNGQAYEHAMPFTSADYKANAYIMLFLQGNTDVAIHNLEFDGNIMQLQLGGQWGDTGRQCQATGILALNNKKLTIRNIYTHHHGQDGLEIGYYRLESGSPTTPVQLDNVVSEYNARQGLSWIGGIGLHASHCKFNHTGRARFSSSPGAGLDVEAENSICRDGTFENCEFVNNMGCGILADSGDSAHLTFNNCSIWGTKAWSVWTFKPYIRFNRCNIHGALAHPFGSMTDPAAATQFVNCTIDDAVHSNYGPTFLSKGILLFDFGGSDIQNVVFDGCRITAKRGKSFWTGPGDINHPMRIHNTTITHGCVRPKQDDYMCILRNVRLDKVHFQEAFPKVNVAQTIIIVGPTIIGQSVIVDGPNVVMQGAHKTGIIPPGLIQH